MLEESNLQEHLEAIHGSYGAAMSNEQIIANLMAGPAPHQYVNLEEALIEYNGQDITRPNSKAYSEQTAAPKISKIHSTSLRRALV